MTQMLLARAGKTSSVMEQVARDERRDIDFVREGVARGTIVIPANKIGRASCRERV